VIGAVGAPALMDPNPGNNTAVVDAGSTPVRSSDLALTITKSPNPSTLGTETTYTLQLTNKGPDAALLAVLSYSLSPGSVVTSFMPGAGWSCVQSGLSFTCVLADVAVGDATPVVIKAITQPMADGTAGSVAGSVSAVQGRDPDPLNNFASVAAGSSTMTAADLAVTLTRTPESPDAGAEVTYRLLATNRGDAPVDGVVVTLRIPDGAEIIRTDFGDWACQQSLSTFTCTRPRLLPGDAPAIQVTVRVPASGDNDVLLGVGGAVATVGSSSNSDPDTSNNVSTLSGVVYRLNGGDLVAAARWGELGRRPRALFGDWASCPSWSCGGACGVSSQQSEGAVRFLPLSGFRDSRGPVFPQRQASSAPRAPFARAPSPSCLPSTVLSSLRSRAPSPAACPRRHQRASASSAARRSGTGVSAVSGASSAPSWAGPPSSPRARAQIVTAAAWRSSASGSSSSAVSAAATAGGTEAVLALPSMRAVSAQA
jgi:uncharacterized repeat protein (TIGR01451 family)